MTNSTMKSTSWFSWLSSSFGLALAGGIAYVASASGSTPGASAFPNKIPTGYRDWRFVSLAREEAPLDDIRVILGNDSAIKAYRDGKLPFPEGAILVRLAYGYDASQENDQAFG